MGGSGGGGGDYLSVCCFLLDADHLTENRALGILVLL